MNPLRALLIPLFLMAAASCASEGVSHQVPPVNPDAPFAAQLEAYRQALTQVCHTGVTPELIALYEAVLRAADRAEYGAGRGSNFGGPRPPQFADQDCFQGADRD